VLYASRFRLLLEGTGLTLAAACVAGVPLDLGASHAGHPGLLLKNHEWTAVLTAVQDAGHDWLGGSRRDGLS
jgi:hypothetical protein